MAFLISCSCKKVLQVREEWAGTTVQCPSCRQALIVPAPPAVAPNPSVSSTPSPLPQSAPPPMSAPPPPIPDVRTNTPTSWIYPPKHVNNLLAVADDSLWAYAKVFVSVQPEYEKLQAGAAAGDVLGEEALRIPFEAVRKVALDRKRANLIVEFREKNKNDAWVNRTREFFIDDQAQRDEIFETLRSRLNPAWQIREEQLSPVNAVVGHVVLIVAMLIALPLLLMFVHWLQGPDFFEEVVGGFRFRIGRWIINAVQAVLRWFGVWIDVVLILAALLVVGVWTSMGISDLRNPPLMWHLEER